MLFIIIEVSNLYNLVRCNLICLRKFACCQGVEESAWIFNVSLKQILRQSLFFQSELQSDFYEHFWWQDIYTEKLKTIVLMLDFTRGENFVDILSQGNGR